MLKMGLQMFGGLGSSGSVSGGGSDWRYKPLGSWSRDFDKYEDDAIEQYILKDENGFGEIVRYKYDDPDIPVTYEWQAMDGQGILSGDADSISKAMAAVLSVNDRRKRARK